jgi:hypothetical protein
VNSYRSVYAVLIVIVWSALECSRAAAAPARVPLEFSHALPFDARRSLVDDLAVDETGYFKNDAILPVALVPDYRHSIVDRSWTLRRWSVEIDRYGWRNPDLDTLPNTVMIGDSVVFGYGVSQDETVPSHLSRDLGLPIYNAAVPGLGPTSYTVMARRYLQMAPKTRLIVIGFFGGNDFTDLDGASWNELAECQAPRSKIHSQAFPPWFPDSKPPWRSAKRTENWQPDRAADWVAYERILREAAVSETKGVGEPGDPFKRLRQEAIQYADAIAKSDCADKKTRALIARYRTQVSRKQYAHANKTAFSISRELFSKRCHPTDEDLAPLDALFYRSAFLQPNITMKLRPSGTTVLRRRYVTYLGKLMKQPQVESLRPTIAKVRELFAARRLPSADMLYTLGVLISRGFGLPPPENCDKVDLALSALSSTAAEHGARILAVYFPHQQQLGQPLAETDPANLCARATQHDIQCLDLTIPIRDESRRTKTSFFVEGSHLNEVGTAFAADRIAEWLRGFDY